MDDLISRKSLMQKLKEYVETVYECDFDDPQCTENGGSLNPKFVQGLWEAKEIIEDIPTAYDVDKVIGQMENLGQSCLEMHDWHGQSRVEDCIEIVKGGGKE